MCGIAGVFNLKTKEPVQEALIRRMVDILRHRGPDEDGYYVKDHMGFGQCRLSIIDLAGGRQPIPNEDRTLWVIFNGEIFNYIELRDFLLGKGHVFRTRTDTEVLVHLYEEYGVSFLEHLNGQFAIALWDEKERSLILARDRVGIRPLFYAVPEDGAFLFGSEMKALFRHPALAVEIDPEGLNQIFTLWVNIPPRTVFRGIRELPPGHYLSVSEKGLRQRPYWKPAFPDEKDYDDKPLKHYRSGLEELLHDAVTLRLRADVPVASYLSGGIDSSIISTLVKKYHNRQLITFSVAFSDPGYDERTYQSEMVSHLGSDHRMVEADDDSIGGAFSDVVWYAEKPMIRTAPAPLFILSGLVRENGIKVVLTGEGADEMFGGYNIFKEDKIRRFWAKNPDSAMRPKLLSSLYPYVPKDSRIGRFWQLFFKRGLTETDHPCYSHLIRWNNTSQIKQLFREDYLAHFDENRILQDLKTRLDPDITRWHPLCRAQYLEIVLFMSGYLLSSQGDRMMMGHSVEGRFPFLDHRVIEFAAAVPPKYKIRALNEKYLLKKTYDHLLPPSVIEREKQPYRAPIGPCFIGGSDKRHAAPLSRDSIRNYPYFDPESVEALINKFKRAEGRAVSARDDMALVGVVSLQLLHRHFIDPA
jgi:asparagine synthase (glutamine-hydrolysing)